MIEFVKKQAEEPVTVAGILREVTDAICDGYCKFPEICAKEYGDDGEDMLYEKYCEQCPLNRISV